MPFRWDSPFDARRQYRRIFIGTRDEHQYLLSFEISNIGSVGTLNRQERLF